MSHAAERRIALALASSLLCAIAMAAGVEDETRELIQPPTPPQTRLSWVAPKLRVDGLPMTVQAFASTRSIDELFAHYRGWSHTIGQAEVQETRVAEDRVLGVKTACCLLSVRARVTTTGSEGVITTSASPSRTPSLRSAFPRPSTTRLVHVQEYDDRDEQAEQLSLISQRAVLSEARDFVALLNRHGWSVVLDAPGRATIGTHVIEVQKGAQHARLTLMPDRSGTGGTAVIILWRKS